MNMEDIIIDKRDGRELSSDQIKFFVEGYTEGRIPDYQAAALLMAIYFNGINDRETLCLTEAMRDSGDCMDNHIPGHISVDKHSTGGVGDKTTLVIAPIVAAVGVPVVKMSGRGLGFSGGTIDKLEAIPGFRTKLTRQDFHEQLERIGIAITGQTGRIAPADKMIYALRDVTGTVESEGLIASSIMSKKLAAGAEGIVLDVKCGRGAFVKNYKEARHLAELMCRIGEGAGRRMSALITNMDMPLGNAVGNALEVVEVIDVLRGYGPDDVRELSINLAGRMIYLAEASSTVEEGVRMAEEVVDNGLAARKFAQLLEAQGADPTILSNPETLLGSKELSVDILAERSGYISNIDAGITGHASAISGAGRLVKDAKIDPLAGVLLRKKSGMVLKGDVIATVYSGSRKSLEEGAGIMREAIEIVDQPCKEAKLILGSV